jgi:hypothetical protein
VGKLDSLFTDIGFIQSVLLQDVEDGVPEREEKVQEHNPAKVSCDWSIPSWDDVVLDEVDWNVDKNFEWEDVSFDWD